MGAKATVRVRAGADGTASRPPRAALDEAAERLAQRGFNVLRIGRFGVSIEGEPSTFRREFGIEVQDGSPLIERPSPRDAGLAKLIDLIEVTSTPVSF
jgi:hypothetical protein